MTELMEPATAVETTAKRSTTLAVTSAATLLVLMNYVAPLATMPAIAAGVDAGVLGRTWILNGIAFGLSALLLVTGNLADAYGRRRMFVIGAVVLAFSSVVSAVANDPGTFVLGRILQGVASAAVLTASLGLIGVAYPSGPARVRATGMWGAMIGAGIALGPWVGGLFAEWGSWRGAYWFFAAGSALVVFAGALVLSESRAAVRPRFDVRGTVVFALGVGALLFAVTEGRLGWTRPTVLAGLLAAAVLLGTFVLVERRALHPLLDLRLFRRPLFLAATLGALTTGLAIIGVMSYVPTVMQLALGQTPMITAAVVLIWSGASFLTSFFAHRLPLGGRHQLAVGLLFAAVGNLILLGFVERWSWLHATAGFVVAGIGSGLVNAALARLAIESVPPERAGTGSGINQTARYVGSSLGVAAVVALVAAVAGPSNDLSAGVNAALVAGAGVALLGGVGALLLRR
ncbi:MFS transporter [Tenggerimyces flavus]|uniref:MFS transporter n=1 Tax=Tenggerimyces flavus TaxID=1708749 RepID=A0ABV7YBT0_9ACTN|nr:MFS transporter [Tenggerimyces flavus]MBM7791365.1 MFS family permease [Tenggerimyces flavus]